MSKRNFDPTQDIEDTVGPHTTIQDLLNKKKRIYKKIDMKKLDQFVKFIIDENPETPEQFESVFKKAKRAIRIQPSKVMMVHYYRKLIEDGEIENSNTDLDNLFIKKIVRRASGVSVITVLTSPYPSYTTTDDNGNEITKVQKFSCGQNCSYCPYETTVVLTCEILNITKKNDDYSDVILRSEEAIDEVRVVTYLTLEKQSKPLDTYNPNEEIEGLINVAGCYDFDDDTHQFRLTINNKFISMLETNSNRCYATKIEQPRSYISTEPAVRRANQNNFDAVLQFFDRATSLEICGTPVDKIELLVLGGTWSHYPRQYQEQFCRDLFYAANIYSTGTERNRLSLEEEQQINQTSTCRIIGLTLETRPDCINKYEIIRFRKYGCTRVQLGVQHIDDDILKGINRGCYTEHTMKAFTLLAKNGFKFDNHLMPDLPGSSFEKDMEMFDTILGVKPKPEKQKIDLHIVFCLLGTFAIEVFIYRNFNHIFSIRDFITMIFAILGLIFYFVFKYYSNTSDDDKRKKREQKFFTSKNIQFEEFNLVSPNLQADQWKIYPTETVRWTDIEKWYRERSYHPYAEEINPETGRKKIVDLLVHTMSKVFPWIRLNRIIRDIPNDEIIAGNQNISLRDSLYKVLEEDGKTCDCIRSREIRNRKPDRENAVLVVRKYFANNGTEYFISFESPDKRIIYGFCRLRINIDNTNIFFNKLKDGCALIRELHVYGIMVSHGQKSKETQHFGFGTKLLETAEEIAKFHHQNKIAVISGVGVRHYYEKRGYILDENTYMMKYFDNSS